MGVVNGAPLVKRHITEVEFASDLLDWYVSISLLQGANDLLIAEIACFSCPLLSGLTDFLEKSLIRFNVGKSKLLRTTM
jgi:hypothetical protein